ncbi:hypothetical protein U1Q18_051620 [Sarracenia purpurea var. burkii]
MEKVSKKVTNAMRDQHGQTRMAKKEDSISSTSANSRSETVDKNIQANSSSAAMSLGTADPVKKKRGRGRTRNIPDSALM